MTRTLVEATYHYYDPGLDAHITVVYMDMEYGIDEQISKTGDNTYTMFINARNGYINHLQAYEHALRHIANKDYEKEDADQIERSANEE